MPDAVTEMWNNFWSTQLLYWPWCYCRGGEMKGVNCLQSCIRHQSAHGDTGHSNHIKHCGAGHFLSVGICIATQQQNCPQLIFSVACHAQSTFILIGWYVVHYTHKWNNIMSITVSRPAMMPHQMIIQIISPDKFQPLFLCLVVAGVRVTEWQMALNDSPIILYRGITQITEARAVCQYWIIHLDLT